MRTVCDGAKHFRLALEAMASCCMLSWQHVRVLIGLRGRMHRVNKAVGADDMTASDGEAVLQSIR